MIWVYAHNIIKVHIVFLVSPGHNIMNKIQKPKKKKKENRLLDLVKLIEIVCTVLPF